MKSTVEESWISPAQLLLESGRTASPVAAAEPPLPAPPPPRRRRGWIWLPILLLAAVAAGLWWKKPAPVVQPRAAGGSDRRSTPVVAVKSEKGSIGVYYDGLGAVTPINTVVVKSRVDGELLQVHYKEGQTVQKGDLLAEIDPRPYQVLQAQAEGQLVRDQALLANARTDLTRYETLIRQNAISDQQLVTQRALIAQYEGTVRTDQGAIDSAKLSITYCRILAPLSGRVGLRLVDPGNIIHTSDSTGLLVITQMQPISVIFTIAEDQLPTVVRKLRAGSALRVDAYSRDIKTRLAAGVLSTIDNQIDQTTGTLKLRAVFDNAHGELFPNQFVNARLLVEEKRGVTLIPTAAVQRNAQGTYVWVVKPDSTVAVQTIEIGVSEGLQTEVVSGLEPGTAIVMTGVDKLQPGGKVNAQLDGEQDGRRDTGSRGAAREKKR